MTSSATPAVQAHPTAAVLTIGNEILSGKVVDENTPWVCQRLRALGIDLQRIEVVPDEIEVIAEAAGRLAAAHTHVFTSGGIGPTHDDVTVEAIARGFGVDVERSPLIERLLREHYGTQVAEAHLRMANVPRGAEVVSGPSYPTPVVVMQNVVLLPGIPQLFRRLFDALSHRLEGTPFHTRRVYVNVPETTLVPALETVTAEWSQVLVGSYPKLEGLPGPRVMLTFDSRAAAEADRACERFVSLLDPSYVVGVE